MALLNRAELPRSRREGLEELLKSLMTEKDNLIKRLQGRPGSD